MKSKLSRAPVLALAVTFVAQAQQRQNRGHQHSRRHHQHQGRPESGRRTGCQDRAQEEGTGAKAERDQCSAGPAQQGPEHAERRGQERSLQEHRAEEEESAARSGGRAGRARADQQKILQQLGQKILAVIERYARDNGYTMVVDVSTPQTPVLYASPSIDITKEIIELYDKSAAAMSAPAAAPKAPLRLLREARPPAAPRPPAPAAPAGPKPPAAKQP